MKHISLFLFILLGSRGICQFVSVPSGITENLTSIWMDEGGDFGVIVGAAGTILHWDGSDWSPVDSHTSQNLYDVHGLSSTDVVASGQEVVLHWDGLDWSQVMDFPNTAITPILLTPNRIWYGIPDSQFPIIGRCDRSGAACLGLVAPTGSVLAMQQHISGDVIFVGTTGSVGRLDESLMNFSFVHEQSQANILALTAADIQLADPFLRSAKRTEQDIIQGADEFNTFTLDQLVWFTDCPTGFDVFRYVDGFAVGGNGLGEGTTLFPNCSEVFLPRPASDIGHQTADLPIWREDRLTSIHDEGLIFMATDCVEILWEQFELHGINEFIEAVNSCFQFP